jgi:hypothetical protein
VIQRGVLASLGVTAALIAGSSPDLTIADASARTLAARPTPSLGRRARDAELRPGCPAGTLPDGPVCVHLPSSLDLPDSPSAEAGHHDRHGSWNVYEQIPRRPDRPADYEAYVYPIPAGLAGGRHVVSGYDLDRPDESQRRGHGLRAVGHGGVDLPQARGTPVRVVGLESQQGDAEVIYVGPLFGTTVVTRNAVREGGRLRDYLVLFGHLERPAPGLAPTARLHEGDVLGFVGDTGSPELVHLHLETRRVRDGVDASKVGPGRLVDPSVSVVCDPRNVLPRKP